MKWWVMIITKYSFNEDNKFLRKIFENNYIVKLRGDTQKDIKSEENSDFFKIFFKY